MNDKYQITNAKKFDLEERTGKFGEKLIKLVKKAPQNTITVSIIHQLVKSGTSMGANYCEADGAESGRDFYHKIAISKKEAKETKHWLRMLLVACFELRDEIGELYQEAHELTLIFSSIMQSRNEKRKKKSI